MKVATGAKQQLKINRMKSRRRRLNASSKTVSAGKPVTIKAPTVAAHVAFPQPVVLPDLMNEAVYRKYLKEAEAEVRETRKQRSAGIIYRVFQQLVH
jgi:tRNA G26 N,N-dimethylase Trm1